LTKPPPATRAEASRERLINASRLSFWGALTISENFVASGLVELIDRSVEFPSCQGGWLARDCVGVFSASLHLAVFDDAGLAVGQSVREFSQDERY